MPLSVASRLSGQLLGLLAELGRHGPAVLFVGVLVGLAVPRLAELAYPLMGAAVFVFTLGAFLKVDWPTFRAQAASPLRTVALLGWATFGVPLAAAGTVHLLNLKGDLASGILLCMLAPPVGSAAAVAAMLGLSTSLALLATVVATAIAPFYLPPLAAAFAEASLEIDPWQLSGRLLVIVGARVQPRGCFVITRRDSSDAIRTR